MEPHELLTPGKLLGHAPTQRAILRRTSQALVALAEAPSACLIGTSIEDTRAAGLREAALAFERIAGEATDEISLAWMAIGSAVLFPVLRAELETNSTPPEKAWLKDLETRFSLLLCGSTTTTSKTPTECVISEWQRYARVLPLPL